MSGSLSELWLAGLFVLASHFAIASTGLRSLLVARLGEGPYRGLFSLIALVGIVWLIVSYNHASYDRLLWDLWPVSHILSVLLMPLTLVFLVGGLTAPNPTLVGRDPAEIKVSGVLRVTRNPVMWGIGVWAVLHMLANGDPPSVIFFGTFAVLALLGAYLIDLKNRERRPAAFAPLELTTSNLPFLAMIQGRQSLGRAIREFGWWRLVAVVVLYAALLHGHAWLFGVSPYAGI